MKQSQDLLKQQTFMEEKTDYAKKINISYKHPTKTVEPRLGQNGDGITIKGDLSKLESGLRDWPS